MSPRTLFVFLRCKNDVNSAVELVVAAELTSLGLELVELRRGGSKGRPVLDVRIDRLDGERVQVGDCERASRAIEARLDGDPSLVPSRYVLEVSSPGMERSLLKAADWRRFVGRRASVNSPVLGGRQELEIVAVDGSEGEEVLLLRDKKGNEHSLSLADVTDARLTFEWKA